MSLTIKAAGAVRVFISYAHEDEDLRNELEKHLNILERQGIITSWHDRKIGAGKEWEKEIETQLNTADIILLLVSPAFMNSDYCWSVEIKRAMERHKAGEARVIPIILRPVYWKNTPFSKLQALPTDARPVTSWMDLNDAFTDITRGVRKAVDELVQPIPDYRIRDLFLYFRFLISSDIALQYFARKYPKDTEKNLLRVGQYSYPIVIYPAKDEQALNPESVLSQESDVSSLQDVELIAPNDEFRRVREHLLGVSMYDGPTYTMKKFDEGPPLRLECGLGSYFQMLHTCDSLMWELLVGLRDVEKSGGSLDSRLKDRNKLHKTVADPIRDGTGRSVAIGGETAFAFIDQDGQVRIFVRMRSEEGVAVYPNVLDVIPSYMFTPFTPDYEAEFSVAHNFYREYLAACRREKFTRIFFGFNSLDR